MARESSDILIVDDRLICSLPAVPERKPPDSPVPDQRVVDQIRARRFRHWLIGGGWLAYGAVVLWSGLVPWGPKMILLLFGGCLAINVMVLLNWRCPKCRAFLGSNPAPDECPRCHTPFSHGSQ